MADPMKRVNYFDHQFLHADDFIDEQKYHIRLRRLHNAALHTWGIARGLDLSFKTGESHATVSEGVAVDGKGREIVLTESTLTPDLSGYKDKTVYITIAYSEKETDSTTETGVSGKTRVTEEPEIHVEEEPPDDPSRKLILGRLKLDENAKINGKDEGEEPNKRRLAGVIGGDLEARSLRLSLPDAASSQWPALSCRAANQVDLTGNLSISGNVGVGTTLPNSPLAVSGGAAIGSGYATKTAPANGLIVQGKVGIGTAEPGAHLHVAGDVMFDGVIKPHYDSGWREVPPNGGDEIQLKHNLGVYPGLIQIFAKSNHKDDGPVLKDHYPDAIKMTNINGDSYSQRVAAGFGVRAITEESITLARGAHLWHGEVGQEFFNQGWIRVFMWRFGIGDMNMPT